MPGVTIPILPSSSFDATAAFYASLGFREHNRWPGQYLILRRADGIELHFWPKPNVDPKTSDSACYVRFDSPAEARALYDEWAKVELPPGARLHKPVETDYGMVELALVDPDGNLLRIGARLAV